MAFYAEKDFFEDDQLIGLVQSILGGNLTLEWYRVDNLRVRAHPAQPERGLTYTDCNLGAYGYDAIPELVRNRASMAARGSVLVPKLPDLGYTVNRKSDVWSSNVCALYEEAKARRWAPAVDIAWSEIAATANPLRETAMTQIATLLDEVALVAMEAPSRWVFVINQEFLELKSFLCAQMLDEARHVEVWRKRALVSGYGLGRASVAAEQGLKELLSGNTYPETSLATNLLLGSFVLAAYRALAALAAGDAERRLATLALQDVARSVAYGVEHMRYHLAHQPGNTAALGDYLDRTEHAVIGVFGSPEFLEPLVVIAGGGRDREAMVRGSAFARRWFRLAVDEYLERARAAGFPDRAARSRLPRLVAPLEQ